MKKVWITFLTCLVIFLAEAQSPEEQRARELLGFANEYFDTEQYNAAAVLYREAFTILRNDPLATYKLAESYRFLLDYNEAEVYYRKALALDESAFPLSEYYYGLMLKLNGDYEESVNVLSSFLQKHYHDNAFPEQVKQAAIELAGAEMALKDSKGMSLGQLDSSMQMVNTAYNDFAPAPCDTLLLITSGRIASNREGIDERYGEAFTDHFYYMHRSDSWVEQKNSILKVINSYYNDGSGQFNHRGDKYYFTECGGADGHCVVKMTAFDGRKWQPAIRLNDNVNTTGYDTKQPSLSAGGDTLFFVSNRPGGMGMNDIWFSIKSGEGEYWGPAINMGSTINTPLNEVSPFVYQYNQVLFFASEGHQGYGGFDIHMAKKLSSGDTVMHNLGVPVNSHRDDFYFSLNAKQAFFSSNRPESTGGFDVFAIGIRSPISLISKVSLREYSGAKDVNIKARMAVTNAANFKAINQEESVEHAQLLYKKETKELNNVVSKSYSDILVASVKIPASLTHHFELTGQLNGGGAHEVMLKSEGVLLETAKVGEDGKFRFSGLRPERSVSVYVSGGPDAGSVTIEDLVVDRYEKVNEISDIDNIYFDFDHYDLRPEAKVMLTELALFLKAHPEAQLEVHAFSDNIGSDVYNLKLTERRGKAVTEFLTSLGVKYESMKIAARGKHKPINANNTEVGRQTNRRVEFYIYNISEPFDSPYETFIVKEKATIKDLAKLSGMNQDEIMEVNGLQDHQLKLYQPVRLRSNLEHLEGMIFRVRRNENEG